MTTPVTEEDVKEHIWGAEYYARGAWIQLDNDRPWRTAEELMLAELSIQRARALLVQLAKQRGDVA